MEIEFSTKLSKKDLKYLYQFKYYLKNIDKLNLKKGDHLQTAEPRFLNHS